MRADTATGKWEFINICTNREYGEDSPWLGCYDQWNKIMMYDVFIQILLPKVIHTIKILKRAGVGYAVRRNVGRRFGLEISKNPTWSNCRCESVAYLKTSQVALTIHDQDKDRQVAGQALLC